MKRSCLYFDKKYKCVSFIVHYKGLTLIERFVCVRGVLYNTWYDFLCVIKITTFWISYIYFYISNQNSIYKFKRVYVVFISRKQLIPKCRSHGDMTIFLQIAVLLAVSVTASHIFILPVKIYAKTLSMQSVIYYINVFKDWSHQSTVWALTWGNI